MAETTTGRNILPCIWLSFRLEVFDRWGNVVFATEDPEQPCRNSALARQKSSPRRVRLAAGMDGRTVWSAGSVSGKWRGDGGAVAGVPYCLINCLIPSIFPRCPQHHVIHLGEAADKSKSTVCSPGTARPNNSRRMILPEASKPVCPLYPQLANQIEG